MMWGFGLGWLWMLLFWALVIGVIVWAATRLSPGSRDASDPSGAARRILDERFARGEIDTDDYRELRDELTR
jgi:putative membrane protein